MILQSAFTSVLDVHPDHSSALVPDMFENMKKIHKVKCPTLLVHGKKDQLIPISHSQKLAKVLTEGVLWKFLELEEAGYQNIESEFNDEMLEEIIRFINHVSPNDYKKKKRKSKTVMPDSLATSPSLVVGMWLRQVSLDKYTDKFLCGGFYDLPTIKTMTAVDLEMIGITDEKERESLLTAIQQLDPYAKPKEEDKSSDDEEEGDKQMRTTLSGLEATLELPTPDNVPPNSPNVPHLNLTPIYLSEPTTASDNMLIRVKQLEGVLVEQSDNLVELSEKLERAYDVIRAQGEELDKVKKEMTLMRLHLTELLKPKSSAGELSPDLSKNLSSSQDSQNSESTQFEESFKNLEKQLSDLDRIF